MAREYLKGMVAAKCSLAASLIADIRSSWEVSDANRRQLLSEAVCALQAIEHEMRADESEARDG